MPPIKKDDVLVHVLNVGFGDAIVIELPCDDSGLRPIGIVDCNSSTKVRRYLKDLAGVRPWSHVAFLCATHPHLDHIRGMGTLLGDATLGVREFWDSGFRHKTSTYQKILLKLHEKKVPLRRVSSGMEWYFGTCKITALAPAVSLRNRYGTYGVDMNNASIVLRIENCVKDAVIIESEHPP